VADDAVANLAVPRERITVVYRGRDRNRLGWPSDERRLAARTMLGLDPEAPVVVAVGREERQKGLVHLIRAMPHVIAEHPDVTLVTAGRSGHASAAIDDAIRETGLMSRVRRLGHRDDVADVLAAGDVFAFPSLWEGLGGVMLEAMALAVPVVASDLPALREVVDSGPTGNARLVAPGDVPALGGAIAELLAHPERRRAMGARGLELFEERFTLEHSATGMIDLLESIATQRRAQSS
jgi:glycosyltransferase involved in cell wall biosynthesis